MEMKIQWNPGIGIDFSMANEELINKTQLWKPNK